MNKIQALGANISSYRIYLGLVCPLSSVSAEIGDSSLPQSPPPEGRWPLARKEPTPELHLKIRKAWAQGAVCAFDKFPQMHSVIHCAPLAFKLLHPKLDLDYPLRRQSLLAVVLCSHHVRSCCFFTPGYWPLIADASILTHHRTVLHNHLYYVATCVNWYFNFACYSYFESTNLLLPPLLRQRETYLYTFWNMVLGSSGWLQTCYTAEDDSGFLILLPPALEW